MPALEALKTHEYAAAVREMVAVCWNYTRNSRTDQAAVMPVRHFARRGALLLLALAVTSCRRDDDSTNRSDGLNPPMQRALEEYAPGFRRFTASEYAPGVDTTYRAEGDFNGDRMEDVALYGRDETRELLLVLLSASNQTYRVIPLQERPFSPFPNGAYISLGTHPAGPLQLPAGLKELLDPAPPERIEYAGISVGYGNEAGEVYYWNGTRFVQVQTGD